MSDEEDYMSFTFLDVKEDIRPGLTFSKSVKRKLEIEKKRVTSNEFHRTKSRKQLEEESRNIGLDTAIDSNNKGFAMLQKMGYKPGTKLGPKKEDSSSDRGLLEPIRVNVKFDRGGLGREQDIRNKIERIKKRREELKVYKEKETELLTEEFRKRMRDTVTNKRLLKDLHQCQKACEQLDKDNDINEPSRCWFWFTQEPINESEEEDCEEEPFEEDEEDENDLKTEEKIEIICDYLRQNYFYCFWCCVKYNDDEDLSKNCPGPEKSQHDDFE